MNKTLTYDYYLLRPFLSLINTNLVNIFTTDHNKPFFDKHYFLIYKNNNAKELKLLMDYYEKYNGYINYYSYRIDNEWYDCFTLELNSKLYKHIQLLKSNRSQEIPFDDRIYIKTYWRCSNIHCVIFDTEYVDSYIPSTDYISNPSEELLKQIIKHLNERDPSILDT